MLPTTHMMVVQQTLHGFVQLLMNDEIALYDVDSNKLSLWSSAIVVI